MKLIKWWQTHRRLFPRDLPKHMIPHVSDRGLLFMPSVSGTYPSDQIGLSESSSASDAAIWLRSSQSGTRATSIHLTLEAAGQLRDQLTYLIENHYQVKPR